MREQLLTLLEPVIQSLGYELVDLEFKPHGGGGLLRLYIDTPAQSEQGITLEDCERTSHQVSGVLDVEDPIPGAYELEVSSPGLNRPLRTSAHFEHFIGERVKIELQAPLDGRKRFTGQLQGMSSGNVAIEMDGREYALPLEKIAKARLAPQL
ncbi:MAG TPA: ribosome maturation factor RimP [Gammaproteobacteria bacterium]|nr:ribosome maturation factor RimP [Gammaproteobacteria bacterium]